MKTWVIGLTGGIGSGKTTAAHFFQELNVPIIDADHLAREVTKTNTPAYQQILEHFGAIVLNPDNTLNRKQLREIIFSNLAEKVWLETLLHPLIRNEMRKQIKQVTTPYCICVIPLLAEASGIEFLDRILVIESLREMQIARTQQRDNNTVELVENILQTQASTEHRRRIAHDIIVNDNDLDDLRQKVQLLHEKYLQMSNERRN